MSKSLHLLQEHLQVLKTAGLITEEEAAKIDSFAKLCPRNLADDGKHVFDVLSQENFDDESDIARLSDKNCYSKSLMQDFVRQGTVDTATGRPLLPLSQQAIEDVDYSILGVPLPTAQQRRAAREEQQMRSFEQLNAGDVEAWRAGRTRAREEFAFFLTDSAERRQLARELGVAVARLAPARVAAATAPQAAAVAAATAPPVAAVVTAPPVAAVVTASVGVLPQKQTISAGSVHSLGLLDDGTVVGWGRDNDGRASGGQALATNGRKFVSVSAGFNHSLGLLDDGSVVGWGSDNKGQATGGQRLATDGRKFVAIAAGYEYSLGLLNDGSVVGWGYNLLDRASGGQTLAANGRKFVAISAGLTHSLGLFDDGTVVGWGLDRDGQATGGQALATNGRKFIAISAGEAHSLGLLDDGSVVGWGDDTFRQASRGNDPLITQRRKFVAISAAVNFSLGLRDNGTVVGWGNVMVYSTSFVRGRHNFEIPGSGLATNGRKFVSISAGSDHSLGLLDDGSVVGWGNDNYGQAKGADAAAGGIKFMLPPGTTGAVPVRAVAQ